MIGDTAGWPGRQHPTDKNQGMNTIRVMSFNMAHGMGMDGHVDLRRTAEVIRASRADIIGLQEVDRHFSARSGFADQAALLAEMLGMQYGFGANVIQPPLEPGKPHRKYGNAVLSRFPVKYAVNHPLTPAGENGEDPEPRGILETFIDLGSTYLNFFSTHMSLSDQALRLGVSRLLKLTGKSPFPTIVTGDFNAEPAHPSIAAMDERFNDVFRKSELGQVPTFPARSIELESGKRTEPCAKIDYIFADLSQTVRRADVIDTAVSDHLPIMADLSVLSTLRNDQSEEAR